jgi:medium-chain acyl-[acyl-carrier-protein] hydrolase
VTAPRDRRVVCRRPNPQAPLRLFCFPYAGGSTAAFLPWLPALSDRVEVHLVEYAGHGTRLSEPPVARLEPLLDDVADAVFAALDRPFAFFGHSMGALVAYELTHRLRDAGRSLPVQLFLSAAGAPHTPDPDPDRPIHKLSDARLLRKLEEYNGVASSVLAHRELMRLMLPIVRADFQACETHPYRLGPPLDCPIAAFGGTSDPWVTPDRVEAWRCYTRARFGFRVLAGDHFFLNGSRDLLLWNIRHELDRGPEGAAARL